ncbi:hypothetical protein [Solirubrobacter soli]|uniref:hypothetical protein n=1 Tax=Solirubrobacter soli TaxID=363832 RepID=UPI00146CA1A7|nr:hypothetical protein [Solirubrobacter soli]
MVAATGVAAMAVGGAVIARADDSPARAAAANGGLAMFNVVQPGVTDALPIEHTAQAGVKDTFTLENRWSKALSITITPRPWTQSGDGSVSPNRRGTLSGVSVSEPTFTLAPGAKKDITVTLDSVPAAGYLYGALEVVGLPPGADKAKGIVTGYRLVDAIRYTAATPTYGLKAGAAKILGKGSKKTLTLSVRNTGNTVAPVTGTVKIKGALSTTNGTVKATRILPGKSVALGLASVSRLRAGSYTATVTLIQNKQKTTLTKQIRVR